MMTELAWGNMHSAVELMAEKEEKLQRALKATPKRMPNPKPQPNLAPPAPEKPKPLTKCRKRNLQRDKARKLKRARLLQPGNMP